MRSQDRRHLAAIQNIHVLSAGGQRIRTSALANGGNASTGRGAFSGRTSAMTRGNAEFGNSRATASRGTLGGARGDRTSAAIQRAQRGDGRQQAQNQRAAGRNNSTYSAYTRSRTNSSYTRSRAGENATVSRPSSSRTSSSSVSRNTSSNQTYTPTPSRSTSSSSSPVRSSSSSGSFGGGRSGGGGGFGGGRSGGGGGGVSRGGGRR